jgi:integrase
MAAKRDFTDRFLKSIKPSAAGKRIIYWDAQVPGFGIRVTDKSTPEVVGSFVLVTRFQRGKSPTARLVGIYPSMPLAKARQIAREWNETIRQGADRKVKEHQRRVEEDRRRADTFAVAFEAFADDHLSTLRTGAAVKKAIQNHVLPHWGNRPVAELRRRDVNELVRNLRKQAPIGANRVLAYLKKFFRWAINQELVEDSPARSVERPSKEQQRDRVLNDAEVRAIWKACAASELGAFGRAFRFMLATGQRRSEVGNLPWSEIDFKQRVWTLPRERAKANRRHEIPLSALAMSILEDSPKLGDFAFSATGARPIAGWSRPKSVVDGLAAKNLKSDLSEDAASVIAEWHLHDLRRTCATNLAKLRVDRIVISKVLNHAEREVTAIYDRHRYDREKRRALDLWGERLQAIVGGIEDGNVVPIAAARGL